MAMSWKRRLLWISISLAVLVLAVFVYDTIVRRAWVGQYDLVVPLNTAEPRKVVRAWYSSDHLKKELAYFREDGLNDKSAEWSYAGNFNGSQISIPMWCTGKTSTLFEREFDYAEYDLAFLKLELDNGEMVYKIVEVPPGRRMRSVIVQVP